MNTRFYIIPCLLATFIGCGRAPEQAQVLQRVEVGESTVSARPEVPANMTEITVWQTEPATHAASGSLMVIPPSTAEAAASPSALLRLERSYRPVAPMAAPAREPIIKTESRAMGEGPVQSGLDVLKAEGFARLKGRKIGLLVNHSSIDREGNHLLDLLLATEGTSVSKIFSPEHGLFGDVDTHTPDFMETRTGIMVYSLYGKREEGVKPHYPRRKNLEGLEVVIIDMQDIGARFYTYHAYMAFMMEECAALGIEVIVLDRPNPIGGLYVDGPLTDDDHLGRATSYFRKPVAHGMTMGEMALMFNAENDIGCSLTVVKAEGWKRGMFWDETGLRWVNPSPNIQDLDAAIAYPGIGMTEKFVSMGRGTTEPFHIFGVPWIEDENKFADDLNALGLDGVKFEPVQFTPSGTLARWHVGENKLCRGARQVITDRKAYRALETGVAVMRWLTDHYGANSDASKAAGKPVYDVTLLHGSSNGELVKRIAEGQDMADLVEYLRSETAKFLPIRAKYLIYPE